MKRDELKKLYIKTYIKELQTISLPIYLSIFIIILHIYLRLRKKNYTLTPVENSERRERMERRGVGVDPFDESFGPTREETIS